MPASVPTGGDRPPALRWSKRSARVAALRALLDGPDPVILPGVVTAMSALQAEHAGFQACYLTGAGLANFEYALPDIGLMGLSEVVAQTRRVVAATTLPVIVDADTGYGGPLSALRAVQELQAAGAAGVQLEDQQIPKRCGHFDGKRLVSTDEMVARIRAAVEAREGGTVIIARTDAIAVEGFEAALERGRAYHEAGADMLFVEAPRTVSELRRTAEVLSDAKLMVNVVEGGQTPELSAAELGALGFSVVLFANTLLRVMGKATADALATIAREGTTVPLATEMLSWDDRQGLVGLDLADELEDRLREGLSDGDASGQADGVDAGARLG